jgi:cyclic-di-AMP phosphodiesterase PgpH
MNFRAFKSSYLGRRRFDSFLNVIPIWLYSAIAGILIITMHLSMFSVAPGLDLSFPDEGQIADREYRAPFDFSVSLPQQDVELRQFQRVLVEPPVVGMHQWNSNEKLLKFESWSDQFLTHLSVQSPISDKIELLALQFPEISQLDLEYAFGLENPEKFIDASENSINQLYSQGIVGDLPVGNYREVIMLSSDQEKTVKVNKLTPHFAVADSLEAALADYINNSDDAKWGAQFLEQFLSPNLLYNSIETRKRQQKARESVSVTRDFIKGERIVGRGDRVTTSEALFLDGLQIKMMATGMLSSKDDESVFPRQVSRIIILSIILLLFGWVASQYFSESLYDIKQVIAITLLAGLFMFSANFCINYASLGIFAIPIPLFAVLLTALFKDKVGYVVSILFIGLLAPVTGVEAQHLLYWLLIGVFSVSMVRRIRTRDRYYKTIAALIVFNVVLITLSKMTSGSYEEIWHLYLVGVISPIASIAIVLFLLPVIEPAIGVSSDLTLLELSDLNHPILKKMALEAQGTFHHSQVVAQLGEQAARAIGANSILVRVGALFHDIGKMTKPEYFIENQGWGPNKHDELSPNMSALIVSAHVKDGIEMAKKWRLPRVVVDFIPEHHGTGIMKVFYHKAMENDDSQTVNVSGFRYPGPKPQSRETAILMLADAIEAATRSLAKPTLGRIREVTKNIIDARLLDGELDECHLTMSDLAKIRDSFIPLLAGIHHARIAYPGQNPKARNKGI